MGQREQERREHHPANANAEERRRRADRYCGNVVQRQQPVHGHQGWKSGRKQVLVLDGSAWQAGRDNRHLGGYRQRRRAERDAKTGRRRSESTVYCEAGWELISADDKIVRATATLG